VDLYYIGEQEIVPSGIWSKISNPSRYVDANPVGTGPYTLSVFNNEGFTMTRQDHYWQPGKPAVKSVNFEIFNSQASDNASLISGQADWGGVFLNNIKSVFVAKDPAHRHYWQPGDATVGFFPNLSEWPLSQLPVRQAVSLAIDRNAVSADGENGQEAPAASATGLVVPADNGYLTAQTAAYKLSPTANVAAAKQVLEKAGYTMGKNGYFQKNGKTLAFTLTDCTNYSDYMTSMQVIAANLKQAGIKVTVKGVSVAAFAAGVNLGSFQAFIRWGTPGPTPYYQYENWLDSAISAPIGKNATGDYERFHSAQAQQYLKAFRDAATAAQQKAALVGLEKIQATQLPVIPLVYSAAWDQYTTSKFTGFPNASNPYFVGTPQQAPTGAEYVILHLKPAS